MRPLLETIALPVIISFAIWLLRGRLRWRVSWLAPLGLLYTTGLLLWIGVRVYDGEIVKEGYPIIGNYVNFSLLADGLSLPVAFIINVLCAALAFYSIPYVKHRIEILYPHLDEETQLKYYSRFFILYLLFPTGFLGVCFSTNLLALYFFLELLPVPLYFIMAYFGYRDRVRVALMCFLWGAVGASLFLVGTLLTYAQVGSFEISRMAEVAAGRWVRWTILFFILGVSTKMALFPFQPWMPWVHAEHPTCIAGLLAVYANIGAYILVRVVILPLRQAFQVFSLPLMGVALFTMVYGSLLTMAQTDVKRLAACSTISQIAYSVLGLAALTTISIEGGMFFFLSHIMGKTIFFSTAGILVYVTGVRDMREMGGFASKMATTALLWIMGAMMLSGFPPFSSFAAEWVMFTGIFQKGVMTRPFGLLVAILGAAAIILTISYTFWSAKRIFYGPLKVTGSTHQIKDPPWTMSLPLLLVGGLSLFLGIYPKPILELFHLVVGGQ